MKKKHGIKSPFSFVPCLIVSTCPAGAVGHAGRKTQKCTLYIGESPIGTGKNALYIYLGLTNKISHFNKILLALYNQMWL